MSSTLRYGVDPALAKMWRAEQPPREFVKRDGLLYFQDAERERLCIPRTLITDLFYEHHDAQAHLGFDATYHSIRSCFWIRGLAKQLRAYITHRPKCATYQTLRHKPYGALRAIKATPTPFHTICIDFVVALPE